MPSFSVGNNQVTVLEGMTLTASYTAGTVVSYVAAGATTPVVGAGATSFSSDPQGTVTYNFWVPAGGSGSYILAPERTGSEGGGVTSAAGDFVGTTVLLEGDSIQAAIDAIPSNLVTTMTTGWTLESGNFYSIPDTVVPNRLYIDTFLARKCSNVDEFLNGTTLPVLQGGGFGGLDYGWCHDAANSKILLFSASGAAPTSVVLRNDWLVLLAAGNHQQRVICAPGLTLVGPGIASCSIQADPLTPRLADAGTEYDFFTLAAAAYCEVRGVRVIKASPDPSMTSDSDSNVSAVVYRNGTNCDNFEFVDSLATDAMESPGVEYARSITVYLSGTAKRSTWMRSDVINNFGEDAIETRTAGFTGNVEFRDLTITGGQFFDGSNHGITYTNVKSAPAQQNGKSRLTGPEGFGGNTFLLNLGSNTAHAGFDYEFAARNCEFSVPRTSSNEVTYWAGWQGKQNIVLDSVVIRADELILPLGTAATSSLLKADIAKKITARNSMIPPVKVFSLLAAHTTPLVPVCQVGVTKTNTTTTPLATGCFSMTYENMQVFKRARVTVAGKFAANANNKTIATSAGLVGALATLDTTTAAHNNLAFCVITELLADSAGVQIMTAITVGTVVRFHWAHYVAVTAGQTFGWQCDLTGVASSDISVGTQRIELG